MNEQYQTSGTTFFSAEDKRFKRNLPKLNLLPYRLQLRHSFTPEPMKWYINISHYNEAVDDATVTYGKLPATKDTVQGQWYLDRRMIGNFRPDPSYYKKTETGVYITIEHPNFETQKLMVDTKDIGPLHIELKARRD
ncbi:MAG: hypothetical protein JKY54_04120 [Flavobacteriales bacterium]|nr:hypothetical protein [Flavobacteriales bacterium]